MIKSFLLNNLLVPIRQISPSMLFASAALHSLLLAVPVASKSNSTELEKGSNSPDEDTTEVSKDICDDEDVSLNDEVGEDSLGEDDSLSEGSGGDSLGEDDSLSEEIGEDSLGEDDSLSEEIGEDSLGEDASLNDEVGEDSLGEDASLSEETGEDSLGEDDSLSEETGEDSLGEDASLSEETGEDSLGEDDSLSEEIGEEDSLGEEIEEGENQTSASKKELCDDGSLPKGKAIKVPGDGSIPLSGLGTEDSSGIEEDSTDGDSLGEDASLSQGGEDSFDEDASITEGAGEETLGDLASIGDGAGEESFDEGDSTPDTGAGEESFDEGDSTPDTGAEEESFDEGDSTPDTGAEESPLDEGDSTPDTEEGEESFDEGDSTPDAGAEESPLDQGDSTPDAGAEESPLDGGDSTEDNQPQKRPVDPFADFPKYTGVKPYVCGTQIARIDRRTRRTSDPLNDVQAYFDKKLADTDFQVEKLTDKPDTKVYQISKGNLTQYLQLFAVKEQGTMILLSSRRVDCYRLNSQKQQEKPKTEEQAFDATFLLLYAQLGWTEENDFAVTSKIEKIFGKDTNKTPDELALLVKTKLESEGFETSQLNDESSEILYEVKKGEFSQLISFVPTKEGKGVIIIALKN